MSFKNLRHVFSDNIDMEAPFMNTQWRSGRGEVSVNMGIYREIPTTTNSSFGNQVTSVKTEGVNSANTLSFPFPCKPSSVNKSPIESFSYSRPRGAARSLFSDESFESTAFGQQMEQSIFTAGPTNNSRFTIMNRIPECSVTKDPLGESFMGEKYHQLMNIASSINPITEQQQYNPRPHLLEHTPHFTVNERTHNLFEDKPRFHSESTSIWGPPENNRIGENFGASLAIQELPSFGIKGNRRQAVRKPSSSISISDEEFERIYESYIWSSSESVPGIEEEPRNVNAKPNEYVTPEKPKYEKEYIKKDLQTNEKRSKARHLKGKLVKGEGCRFCISNGEVSQFCYTHKLKDDEGNITCPVLSKYTCPNCGATGPLAHTKRHCPLYEPMTSSKVKKGCVNRRNAAGHIVVTRV